MSDVYWMVYVNGRPVGDVIDWCSCVILYVKPRHVVLVWIIGCYAYVMDLMFLYDVVSE